MMHAHPDGHCMTPMSSWRCSGTLILKVRALYGVDVNWRHKQTLKIYQCSLIHFNAVPFKTKSLRQSHSAPKKKHASQAEVDFKVSMYTANGGHTVQCGA